MSSPRQFPSAIALLSISLILSGVASRAAAQSEPVGSGVAPASPRYRAEMREPAGLPWETSPVLTRLPPTEDGAPSPSDLPMVGPAPVLGPHGHSDAATAWETSPAGPSPGNSLDCCTHCSRVYGNVEFLYLHRPAASGAMPLLVDVNTGEAILTGNSLDFGYQPGMRATFGLRGGDLGGVEFSYLGYFDNSATASARAADYPGATLALPGDLGGASNVFFGLTEMAIDYSSAINSFEINWTCCCCDCRANACGVEHTYSVEWLAGFRYLTLDEQLTMSGLRNELGGVETGVYHIDAENDLYGTQLGLRGKACRGRWSGEATGKAGLYLNDAGQSQYLIDYPNFPLREVVGGSGTSVAFVGELNFTAIYQLNQTWGLRAGYNLLWVQGVALAPSQLDYTFTPDSATSHSRNDGLFLHGFNFGVEARW